MSKARATKERDPAVTSRMMAAVRNKDSKAEVLLRHMLWRRGLRYRKHGKQVGKPDIVFGPAKVAVFVDGDFWHGNAWRIRGLPNLESMFPNRTEWWVRKIGRNIERDREVTAALSAQGWCVLRYWESDVMDDAEAVADQIEEEVRLRRPSASG